MIRSAGMTLIELMIAMTIASVLMIGAMNVFAGARAAYRSAESLARARETLRFARGIVEADLQLAGFPGRRNAGAGGVSDPTGRARCRGRDVTAWALDRMRPIEILTESSALPCPARDPLAESDILVVRYARPAAGDGEPEYVANAYYISARSKFDDRLPALRRHSLARGVMRDEEIIAGIGKLAVQLGIDANGDGQADAYIDADAAGSGQSDHRTVAVRLTLEAVPGSPAPRVNQRRPTVMKTILLRNMLADQTNAPANPAP